MPLGKIRAHIAGNAGCSRGESDQVDGAGLLSGDNADFFQTAEGRRKN